ncbi:MAG: hypothetical protein IKN27_02050, partial [Selenomonadaceae bacterium]|nr:hypothetical protein [Selenomonadaceae bacterium]
FIAMSWAGAAMGAVNAGIATNENLFKQAAVVVGIVAESMLGNVGGMVAVLGVIVLAITSGDTALRSLRIMLGDALHIDQKKKVNAFTLASVLFVIVALVLYYAKTDKNGFAMLWRYFSWANETIAVFAFAMISVYMMKNKMPYLIALLPGTFYIYIVATYILHAPIGFGLEWAMSYGLAGVVAALYAGTIAKFGKNFGSPQNLR